MTNIVSLGAAVFIVHPYCYIILLFWDRVMGVTVSAVSSLSPATITSSSRGTQRHSKQGKFYNLSSKFWVCLLGRPPAGSTCLKHLPWEASETGSFPKRVVTLFEPLIASLGLSPDTFWSNLILVACICNLIMLLRVGVGFEYWQFWLLSLHQEKRIQRLHNWRSCHNLPVSLLLHSAPTRRRRSLSTQNGQSTFFWQSTVASDLDVLILILSSNHQK